MALINELRDNLGITGNTQDVVLTAAINRGTAYLNDLAGVTLDFTVDGLPKSLLLDFCRYAYNNATEYFEENFAKEILRMQLQSAVIADADEG